MNLKKILSYTILLTIICSIPIVIDFIVQQLNGSKGNTMIVIMVSVIFAVNIAFAFLNTKYTFWKKIMFPALVTIASIILSILILQLNLFPGYDPYGIITLIVANGVFTVITWEIVFQLNN